MRRAIGIPGLLLGLCLGVLAAVAQLRAGTQFEPITREKTGDQFWNFTVRSDRLRETEAGDFFEFRVTAEPTRDNVSPLPYRSAQLRIYDGKEFISSCEVRPAERDGALSFSFRVAVKYAERSRFTFAEAREEFGSEGRYYGFRLSEFTEPRP